jgi:hypothetical protein
MYTFCSRFAICSFGNNDCVLDKGALEASAVRAVAGRWNVAEFGAHDFEFDWSVITDRAGRKRRVRIGMPRLPFYATQPVFYLFRLNPKTGKIDGPGGTGCVVARRSERFPDQVHLYAITNHHVIVRGGSIIRINYVEEKKLKSRFIEKDPSEWQFLPNGDDLVAIDITQDLNPKKDYITRIPETAFATLDWARKIRIGVGDEVAMVGLFASHSGGDINVPIARFGNISLIASEFAKVRQPNGMECESHLVDMRSRTGFSGSPVFVYRRFEVQFANDGTAEFPNGPDDFFMRLLGIQCAQFEDTIDLRKASKTAEVAAEEAIPLVEGDKLRLPSSIEVVIPAWRISELLDIPFFQLQRKDNDAKFAEEADKTPTAEASFEANDENPTHRKDFMRLLGAAVRKPEPKEQT